MHNIETTMIQRLNVIYIPIQELELKKKNGINKVGSFLDLRTTLENNRLSISLYDKREDFTFFHCLNVFICCNISSKIFYTAFGVEILRIAKDEVQIII